MAATEPDAASQAHRRGGQSVTRVAYEYVKERLLDGRFPGGMLLSENELAQRLGVSRTPVRQAFVHLEAEGLIELHPRRGGLVVPISPSEADDVLEARLILEQHCARRAAAAGGPLLQAELEAAIAEQERIAATTVARDPGRIRRFIAEHRALAAALAAGDGERAAELTGTHLHSAHELARRR